MTTKVLEILGHEPITKDEAKDWIKVSPHNNDDRLLVDVLIPAVRSYFERHLDISLIEKRMRVVVENADANFRLPQWPVDIIELIEPATLTEENGRLDNVKGENIGITYTTGEYVKPEIKAAMLNLLSHWYLNRDMATVPESVDKVIKANTRILWFV